MGAQRLLTINTGSSSLKAALYRLFDMVVLNGMSRYHLAAEALRRAGAASGLRSGDRAPKPDLRVRSGDLKGHRLLEGALRGPARDKQLDLDTMNPPTET